MSAPQNYQKLVDFPKIPKALLFILILLPVVIIGSNLAVAFFIPDPGFKAIYMDISSPIWNLAATASLFYAAKKSASVSRRMGTAWMVIALGQLAYTIADSLWAFYEVGLGQSPFPSLADAFYLAQYPMLLLGIHLLPARPLKRIESLKIVLDILIIMLAAAMLLWNYLLGPIAASNSGEDPLVLALSLAYPIGDLMMLGGMLILLYRQMAEKRSAPLFLLMIGTASAIIADYIYGYQSLLGTYLSGSLLDTGWTIEYILFAWAGIWQAFSVRPDLDQEKEESEAGKAIKKLFSRVGMYFPYVWIALAYLLLLRGHYQPMPVDFSTAAWVVGGVIGLVLLRQVVTILENHTLVKDQQESNRVIQLQAEKLSLTNQMLQREIEEQRQAEEKLAHDALHDALTGLPNRILFVDRLNHVIDLSKRSGHYKYAVLFLDLDHFKVVNDSLGHSTGDRLLIEISKKLQACVREIDTIARLGGDEFVILLEDLSNISEAITIVGRIQDSLCAPIDLDGHLVFASASVGIVFDLTHYAQPDEILQDADIAMYQAKTNGKAQFEVFKASYRERAIKRLELENDLRCALEREEFELYYQPIVSLLTDEISGFEALLRWHHPALGMIQPAGFIPLAEETGLIVPIGLWVLKEACRQLIQWQARYPKQPPMAMNVNISERQLLDNGFIPQLECLLRELPLSGRSLCFEITEKVCLERSEKIVSTMNALQQMGIQLHIDDFGTGYSSLSYLQYFPIQTIKIDRSFIAGINSSESDRNIVETIIALARHLHMETIAEGVETEEQKHAVIDLGCAYGQGFLMSRPMSREKAEAFLDRSVSSSQGHRRS